MEARWRSASFLLAIAVMLGGSSATAASATSPLWHPVADAARTPAIRAERFHLFSLDRDGLAAVLARPDEAAPDVVVRLPMPDGRFLRFRVFEAPAMVPSLAARLPWIKTYAGQSLDDPTTSVRFSLTPAGLHAQILTLDGTAYIHPYLEGDTTVHASYYGRDYPDPGPVPFCQTIREHEEVVPPSRVRTSPTWGAQLREYKFALVGDAEFFQKNSTPGRCADGTTACDVDGDCSGVGGPCSPSLASRLEEAHVARVNLVNDINGFLEIEAGMRYVLVDDSPGRFTIFWDPDAAGYPFTQTTACSSRDDVEQALAGLNASGTLPYSSYDLGHLASGRWLGGCASSHVSCDGSTQGRGVSGRGVPVAGDPWWIYLVRHESSHQLDAGHTYTGRDGSCTSGQMDGPASVEPGAGSTFMSYDGFCGCDNIRDYSVVASVVDDHYHSVNIDLMRTEGDNHTCWDAVSTGNQSPSVDAGPNVTIPKGTPFYLDVASSSDPDFGDVLTYVWEPIDNITSTDDRRFLSDPDDGQIPLFRSVPPATASRRYFPSLANVRAGYAPMSGEKLPTLGRTMTMRVTVRDNHAGGGGVAWDERLVTVHSGSGPFAVTSPGFSDQWQPGSRTVTWDVASTNASPVNVSSVRITLSTDDGETFDQVLASSTPNDGSSAVTIPAFAFSRARIMVEAIGGVFFDVSESFLIGDCTVDADCDDGLFCDGIETCGAGGTCQPGSAPCVAGLCLERYDYCGSANEGYVISRNADFSTQDRVFYRNEYIHSLVWTDDVDYSDPKQHTYDLKDSATVTMNLCSRLDFTYDDEKRTRPSDLGDSTSQDWQWDVTVKDNSNNKYEPTDDIQIIDCTADAQCLDALFCNGVEYCNEGTGWCFDGPDPCGGGFCDEATDTCIQCFDDDDCDNGSFCDGFETCQGGQCVDGPDPCVDQAHCDEANEICLECVDQAECLDALFCNGEEQCQANTCVDGPDPCVDLDHCDEDADECIECMPPDELLYIYGAALDGGRYPLFSFSDANDPEQVTGYNVYRSTDPALPHALWTLVASDVTDEDPLTPGIQWTDGSGPAGSQYYQVAAYNNLCPAGTDEGPW